MISDYLLGAATDSYGFDRAGRFITYGREKINKCIRLIKIKKQYILRIIKNPADSIGQTKAEMDWLCIWLSGVTVPSPLKTERGELAFFGRRKWVKPALSPAS